METALPAAHPPTESEAPAPSLWLFSLFYPLWPNLTFNTLPLQLLTAQQPTLLTLQVDEDTIERELDIAILLFNLSLYRYFITDKDSFYK